ncbi:DUF5004 domain-containing protein [Pedobacter caeni]|uniref:DUF5004 domain-containing protein n=1 Tax=Pedobacter caeni TaxID=288992 RepID=A0A1M5E0G6_9SPHI|nr:DUF5004 domain-containing protein [Pedobacter caeni]SHF72562.1 protein of unknown function [Pedobacter caeni]
MKKLKYIIFLLVVLSAAACKKDQLKDIGEPRKVVNAMKGNWTLNSVIQVDEYAKDKLFPFTAVDLTGLYPYRETKLTLNTTEDNKPATFNISFGNSPKFLKTTQGNWTVDNYDTPQTMTLTNGTTTDQISLGKYGLLDQGELLLSVKKYQVGSDGKKTLVLSNNYYFKKAN